MMVPLLMTLFYGISHGQVVIGFLVRSVTGTRLDVEKNKINKVNK